jgi:hypothetical protein
MKAYCGLARLLAVFSAMAAFAVIGGATTSSAATSFEITLAPLIGTSDINVIPQVSYGGKIGYHLHIRNSGNSTTQHASIVVTSNLGTFSDGSDTANCAVNPKDAHQMLCTPFGGTFTPGTTFDVDLRFTAPASGPAAGEQVSTFASITVSAQTVGGNKSNGTTIAQSAPVVTNVVENTANADTFLRKNESAGTGNLGPNHPQKFSVNLPAALFGNPFGIAVSMHDIIGTLCTGCFGAYTQLTIPSASSVSTPGNPFYNGTFNPYSWAMNAQYSSGSNFKLHGVFHIEDNSTLLQQVPSCASLVTPANPTGNPTTAVPLCYDTLDQINNKKMLVATGRGLENGSLGWN